jgi:hypothetical protein
MGSRSTSTPSLGATVNVRPHARRSVSRVSMRGTTRPDSMRAMAGWAVPVRRATSDWLRPARRLASRSARAASIPNTLVNL